MQLQLPFFPKSTKMVSDCLGVYEQDGIVQYILNGLPAFSHIGDDLNSFRYITSNFIHQGLCSKAEVARCFGVSIDSVYRSCKIFIEERECGFFGKDHRKGVAHKLGVKTALAQTKLDKGQSVSSIAREIGVSEGAVRYSIKQGYLKKKALPMDYPPVPPTAATKRI